MTRERDKLRLTRTVLEQLLGDSLLGGMLKLIGALVVGISIYYAIEKRISFVEERQANVIKLLGELHDNQKKLSENLTAQSITLARLAAVVEERKRL